jgi:hypothetical protein
MNYLRDALRQASGCSNQKSLLDLMINGRRPEICCRRGLANRTRSAWIRNATIRTQAVNRARELGLLR